MGYVFRVNNVATGDVRYLEKMPHVRRYRLENSANAEFITVEKLEWHYKWQLVQMLNEAVKQGEDLALEKVRGIYE
jgi:hypothetical protein